MPALRTLVLALLLALLPAPASAADIVSYAIVQHDGTLKVRGKTIRLHGVYIVDRRPFCGRNFRPAQCKTRAAVALESRIQGFVHCRPQLKHRDRSISAFCTIRGPSTLSPPIDLGAYLIKRGWAVALPEAPFEYHTLERIARANGRGVWGFQVDSFN